MYSSMEIAPVLSMSSIIPCRSDGISMSFCWVGMNIIREGRSDKRRIIMYYFVHIRKTDNTNTDNVSNCHLKMDCNSQIHSIIK